MKVLSAFVCVLLLAGSFANTVVNRDAGDEYAFTIIAIGQSIATCNLKTPAGDILSFTPGVASSYGDRFELQETNSLPSCSVLVRNLQESDSGEWELSFVNTAGTTGTPQSFRVVVSASTSDQDEPATSGPDELDVSTEDVIDDNSYIKMRKAIEFPTRTNQTIDISLPRIDYEEECFLITPKGDTFGALNVTIQEVTFHNSSYFVSCRVTICPIVEDLLGNWTVCGKYTDNQIEYTRCQPANIYWNSANRPGTDWHIDVKEEFDHPVHINSTLSPVVIGIGDVVACHIITREGEDLAIDQNSNYPSISVTVAYSTCSFAIGPIHTSLLGDWEIYGLFTNSVEGLHEVRLPFRMNIYDDENPSNQAYNRTVLDPVIRAVNFGNTLNVGVSVSSGLVDSCSFITPDDSVYTMGTDNLEDASFVEVNGDAACRVTIGPITESLLGNWTVNGKFSNNGIFTELQQTFYVIKEDPENPIEEGRLISYLTAESVDTEIGQRHRFVIPSHEFIYAESCHIRTPKGREYTLQSGHRNSSVANIDLIDDNGVECGVMVTVATEDMVGEWTLIARAKQHSKSIERRLPFTINVEESVRALQDTIALDEGSDLYVSLKHPTEHHETCKLIGPFGFECQAAVRDPNLIENCGFIRKNVQSFNSGTWTITYGDRIVYRARIAVTVNAENISAPDVSLTLVRDQAVAQLVGPENSVYCRLEDPQGLAVFDSFGRCQLNLDKVGLEHHGAWKMLVAASGKVLTEEHSLAVSVIESEGKPMVSTNVTQAKPIVTLTCSVQPSTEVTGCKFRNPQGKILIATPGLAEDRYQFYGKGASVESGVIHHECGIRITDPVSSDMGLWRCALDTATDTYYGHLPVLCPWALSDPAVPATVQQEPILKATRSNVTSLEEEPAVMSCSIEAAIRYCYFRASNGTIFSVTPGMSSSTMQYVGAGFDAGECGLRFQGLHARDSGRWSCHVGLVDDHTEQRDLIQVTVRERMITDHYVGHGNVMTVRGYVYEGRSLEYCRFVRIDGLGFTTDEVPSGYTLTGILANGECQFTARNPTMLELHPWTIAAKIRGQNVEIVKDTMESVLIVGPTPGPEDNQPDQIVIIRPGGLGIFMYVFLSLLLLSIVLGGLLAPKKNRQWTAERASSLRRSFSNSFRKPQQPVTPAPNYTP